MRRDARPGGERGAAGVEVLPLAVLVLVVATLLVAQGWAIVDVKLAASAAAREAARAHVEATTAAEATVAAERAAAATMADHGRDPSLVDLRQRGEPFGRCARVTVEVAYPLRWAALPWLRGPVTSTVRAQHSEIVDPYRSGLAGTARCG